MKNIRFIGVNCVSGGWVDVLILFINSVLLVMIE